VSMNGSGRTASIDGFGADRDGRSGAMRSSSSEVMALPPFKRGDYVTLHEAIGEGNASAGLKSGACAELERNSSGGSFSQT